MSEADVIARTDGEPVTAGGLARDLRALGITAGDVVLCHASLSALGWVCGGAEAVLDALLAVLGPRGTLVMPAHSTGISDPARWESPAVPETWWPIIRRETPAYDPTRTPTRGMGRIADAFRTRPGVLRSAHPLMSLCAQGPRARWILDPHPLADACGEGSPLARLYDEDALVLLLGVDHGSNTSLHLAEHRARWPGRARVRQGAPMQVDGERRWVAFDELDYDSDDFARLGDAFGAAARQGTAGRGTALLMRQRALVDFGVEWIEANRAR